MRERLLRISLVALISLVPVFAEPSPPRNFAGRVFDVSVVLDWTPPPEGGSYQLMGPGCQAAPRPPTLFAPRILDGLVTLQWVPGLETCFETTYALFVGTVPGRGDFAPLVAPAGTTSVWGTPPPGVCYAYLVAQNSIGVSAPSNVVEFRVGQTR